MTRTSKALVMSAMLVIGWFAGVSFNGSPSSTANAQGGKGVGVFAPPASRYQISAFGYSTPQRTEKHGAYIVDATTGDVFLTVNGNKPEAVGSVVDIKK
jgi:hypothetical protein